MSYEVMAQEGIIRPSNNPWCAPAVYVLKSNGEIRICVDFMQLNRLTKKDSYPVPRTEDPQQKLAGKTIFSKLDLRSAYLPRTWLWALRIYSDAVQTYWSNPDMPAWNK